MADPVVLVHGIGGFDVLLAGRRPRNEFFPGIQQRFLQHGYEVFLPKVSPTASIVSRAHELASQIRERFGNARFHIMGHSMGGLDARYLIGKLGFENQVLSLTTIGTPHRGTSFADWALRRLSWLYRCLGRRLGITTDAFLDLTTEACARFNETVPYVPNLPTLSVAGVCTKPWLGPEWVLPSIIVGDHEGSNDGIVSVQSATWGDRCETWQADHLNLVNWPNRKMQRAGRWNDRSADYLRIISQLPTTR